MNHLIYENSLQYMNSHISLYETSYPHVNLPPRCGLKLNRGYIRVLKMSSQIKMQVLAIDPSTKRTYSGRSYWQRQFQVFIDGKVAVHNVNAPDGDEPEAKEARAQLDGYQAGYYMADLEVRQGDRGRLEFAVAKLTPIIQGKPAQAT